MKSNIQRYILSAEIALTNVLPGSCQKLSPEVDRTGADLILLSVKKWEETSVNKCHGHILLIIFIIYLLFIFDLHIFLYTDSHSLMMLWRTFEETTNRVCAVLALRLRLFSYYNMGACGEGVVYLTSPGRPTEIGLQLGKACYPCSR